MSTSAQDHEEHDYSPGERAILKAVRALDRKVDRMASEEAADFAALEQTVTDLEGDEHEVAGEFAKLAEEIKGLEAGQPVTAAQINELNAKAVALGEKLKGDVASA